MAGGWTAVDGTGNGNGNGTNEFGAVELNQIQIRTDAADEKFESDDHPLLMLSSDTENGLGSGSGSGRASAVFNLATSVVGAGIMALPAAMKVLGLPAGLLTVLLMGALSEATVEVLVRLGASLKAATYGDVAHAAGGRGLRLAAELCIVVNNAGILVVYLIIIGDVVSGGSSGGHGGLVPGVDRRVGILAVLVLFLAPLCAVRRIDSLKFSSAASVALAVVFVVAASAMAVVKIAAGSAQRPRMLPDLSTGRAVVELLVVVPIMTNAFVCHFNVQPILNELRCPSPPAEMKTVGRITSVICVVIYACTATAGYLLFGDATQSDILVNFDRDLDVPFGRVLRYVVRVGYVVHLILVFPVIHFSLRQTIDCLLFKNREPLSESRCRFFSLTVALLTLLYLGSALVPNIWVAFQFTGATCGLALAFMFPAVITLRCGDLDAGLSSAAAKAFAWVILIMALIVSVIGVVGNILDLAI